jgi:hypothetical protein
MAAQRYHSRCPLRMSSGEYTMRRRAARTILFVGALLQALLISALPLFSMDSDAWRSFLLLLVLLVVSIGSAIALRRWNRQVVMVLTIGSLYAAILIAWTAVVSLRQVMAMNAAVRTAQMLSITLALGTFATLPIALAIAWPLRHVPLTSDTRTDITSDS